MSRYKRHRSGWIAPNKRRCRLKGCDGYGYNGYCPAHTPDYGVGILRCYNCGMPCNRHSMLKLCWEPDTHGV